ncbi:hypothetical protein LIER_42239 [Lithospermum erythrorhizon]|uniref:Uncharacterized protein n=1 Tax=Lithospermum erythrorhizon TaxID=34254 RepID=A0AAV3RLG1_LITER
MTLSESVLSTMPLYYLKALKMLEQIKHKIESLKNRLWEGSSMWSKYMFAKYCKLRHPINARVHPAHSRIWKNFVAVREQDGRTYPSNLDLAPMIFG